MIDATSTTTGQIKVSDLIGRWDIVSWLQLYDDGRRQAPLGDRLEGFIRYLPASADGSADMICMIARADRANFTTGGQWDASEAEKAGAYNSMLAYAGRYRLEGDTVIHEVTTSLFPNWKGGEQRRHVRFEGRNKLFIEARLEAGTPQARTAQLAWVRAEGQ
jgi:hypothetical protein